MNKFISVSVLAVALVTLVSGCAGPEDKLGRGVSNTFEVVRMGEVRRSIEQTAIFDSSSTAFTTGLFRGIDHSAARVGLGLVEIVTFPIPPYEPMWTSYVVPGYVGPESYRPGLYSDAMFDTDTYSGFSGGDVAPFIPGSRFQVFDN